MVRTRRLVFILPVACAALLTLVGSNAPVAPGNARAEERQTMVRAVAARLHRAHMPRDYMYRTVMAVMGTTPRHAFVPERLQAQAYEDVPLDIGADQTISAPSIVAQMTMLLRPKKTDTILEIGTGSGYQAAILSPLVAQVYSVEIVDPLAKEAAARLAALGYANITVQSGDGYAGWPTRAPFDGIIVTAGATRIPPALIAQLKPGGRMVIPLGPSWAQEQLTLVEKAKNGTVKQTSFGQVFFVDFTGQMPRRR